MGPAGVSGCRVETAGRVGHRGASDGTVQLFFLGKIPAFRQRSARQRCRSDRPVRYNPDATASTGLDFRICRTSATACIRSR